MKDKVTTDGSKQDVANDLWLDRLRQVECQDATYRPKANPLVFDTAQGSEVTDIAGRTYIDLCAGFGALPLGHNPPELQTVFERRTATATGVKTPISHGLGDVYPSKAKVLLLEQLLKVLPAGFERVSLALSGGQAVEVAVKTAHLATGKRGFISFEGGYHGLDLGILPLTSRIDFREPFEGWHASATVERLPWGASSEQVKLAAQRLKAAGHGLAGIIVEPIQGRAGVRPASLDWLGDLRQLCNNLEAALIYDEVFTGLGRTGLWTWSEQVPCDLLCLGKALGGSLPLSACVGRGAIMDAWPESTGEALHTGTFFGHPLSCELGLATLTAIKDQQLVERSKNLGREVKHRLQTNLSEHPLVKEVRGQGLMIAIEFREAGAGARFMEVLRSHSLITLASGQYASCLSITPALNIEGDQLHHAISTIHDAIVNSSNSLF